MSETVQMELEAQAAPAPYGVEHGTFALPAVEPRRIARLAKTLGAEVIPRLVLSRLEKAPRRRNQAVAHPTADDVMHVCGLARRGDSIGCAAFLAELRGRGVPLDIAYLELLAPAARHLGELWAEDACDFSSVAVGLCCLQQVVLQNSHLFHGVPTRGAPERRVLLAPTPGEQHSFGLLIVAEFLRRDGWEVSSGTGAGARELIATVRKQWFGLVGLSISCEERLGGLASLIRDMRRSSRNPRLGVLVGGPVFAERPELAVLVGADATASDGRQAVLKAEALMGLLAQEESSAL